MGSNPRKLQIWSHLVKKSLTENFAFCAVKFNLMLIFLITLDTVILNTRNSYSEIFTCPVTVAF